MRLDAVAPEAGRTQESTLSIRARVANVGSTVQLSTARACQDAEREPGPLQLDVTLLPDLIELVVDHSEGVEGGVETTTFRVSTA